MTVKRILALAALAAIAGVLVARTRTSKTPPPAASGTWELADDPASVAFP